MARGETVTATRGVAQLGSALRSGRRGRGFESRHPDGETGVHSGGHPFCVCEGRGLSVAGTHSVRMLRGGWRFWGRVGASGGGLDPSRVHGVDDLVQAVREEVAVGVEGHRCRRVAKHLLYDLDVRARGDGQ